MLRVQSATTCCTSIAGENRAGRQYARQQLQLELSGGCQRRAGVRECAPKCTGHADAGGTEERRGEATVEAARTRTRAAGRRAMRLWATERDGEWQRRRGSRAAELIGMQSNGNRNGNGNGMGMEQNGTAAARSSSLCLRLAQAQSSVPSSVERASCVYRMPTTDTHSYTLHTRMRCELYFSI